MCSTAVLFVFYDLCNVVCVIYLFSVVVVRVFRLCSVKFLVIYLLAVCGCSVSRVHVFDALSICVLSIVCVCFFVSSVYVLVVFCTLFICFPFVSCWCSDCTVYVVCGVLFVFC